MSVALMAKKQAKPKPDVVAQGGGETEARVRTGAVVVRGVPAWKEWVEELAEHDRSPSVNDLVDRALVFYARHVGFGKPAPKR